MNNSISRQFNDYEEISIDEENIYENGVFIDFYIDSIYTVFVFKLTGLYKEIIINNSTGDAIRINTFKDDTDYRRKRNL